MSDIRTEEYKFLRQEHENNRKFVFERPLVIVGGTIATGFAFAEKGILGLLPLPFLLILWFNLWFTHNRLQSSSRIVAYIQLIHETNQNVPWIGWENALREYRNWIHREEKYHKSLSIDDIKQSDNMTFYKPIFYFHLINGIIFTIIFLMQSEQIKRLSESRVQLGDIFYLTINIIALIIFILGFIPYAPKKLKNETERKRHIWKDILKLPQSNKKNG